MLAFLQLALLSISTLLVISPSSFIGDGILHLQGGVGGVFLFSLSVLVVVVTIPNDLKSIHLWMLSILSYVYVLNLRREFREIPSDYIMAY